MPTPPAAALQRSPVLVGRRIRLRRYWTPVRLLDALAGFRDGRRGLPLTGCTTQYTHRLATMAEEQARTVRHQLDLALAPLLRERSAAAAELAVDAATLADLEQRAGHLRELDAGAPAPTAVPGSPAELDAARARMRLAADTARAGAEVRAAQQRSREVQVRLDELDAEIATAHALAVSHVGRCVEHHQRRAQTYLRALVRRQPDRAELAGQLGRTLIAPPAWVTEPPALPEVLGAATPGPAAVLSLADHR
ncbi:hypothetical protein [Trujillonella humicola]|uniref:hypothetical protein n=1 Tax=Trujillonella humicola TaxID=3383699 RepID=UPI00390624C1